ncbi:MAG: hypothetical protein NTX38_01080 [Methylobacter sp.]|nr:hypothetical protein [Methylobacter sp.]
MNHLFFILYGKAKIILNGIKYHKGQNSCEGWQGVATALTIATECAQLN